MKNLGRLLVRFGIQRKSGIRLHNLNNPKNSRHVYYRSDTSWIKFCLLFFCLQLKTNIFIVKYNSVEIHVILFIDFGTQNERVWINWHLLWEKKCCTTIVCRYFLRQVIGSYISSNNHRHAYTIWFTPLYLIFFFISF